MKQEQLNLGNTPLFGDLVSINNVVAEFSLASRNVSLTYL